jgi:hypothetical protein
MPDLSKDEAKNVVKEALHEWLDEKFMQFGKWSLGAALAMIFAGLAYLALIGNGWHKV